MAYCGMLARVVGERGARGEELTFAIPTMQEKIMVAIQGIPCEGPRDVHAKPKRPMVSSGARNRSHHRRASGFTLPGLVRRSLRKWWIEGRYER